jgi:hypothetical protein
MNANTTGELAAEHHWMNCTDDNCYSCFVEDRLYWESLNRPAIARSGEGPYRGGYPASSYVHSGSTKLRTSSNLIGE